MLIPVVTIVFNWRGETNKSGLYSDQCPAMDPVWCRKPGAFQMMGHTKQETSKNYYDVNIPEIIEGTKRADFKKLGI
jgi:hypothetical protein